MEDRRKCPRFDTAFQVKYYPANNDTQFSHTIANDVSRGGLCMPALSSIVRNGDIIKMDINHSDGKGRISATGRVKWTSMLRRQAFLDQKAGIEFIDIAPSDIDRLVKVR